MAFPAPLYTGDFTAEERAMVAGFLLHFRRGFLQAADSVVSPGTAAIPGWSGSTRLYFEHAESVTRFLLYWIGYPVKKGLMWEPFYDAVYPPVGFSWLPPAGG